MFETALHRKQVVIERRSCFWVYLSSGVASPIFFWGARKVFLGAAKKFRGTRFLTLGEQQYFVWDIASQNTELLGMLKIWGAWTPGTPLTTPMDLRIKVPANHRAQQCRDR